MYIRLRLAANIYEHPPPSHASAAFTLQPHTPTLWRGKRFWHLPDFRHVTGFFRIQLYRTAAVVNVICLVGVGAATICAFTQLYAYCMSTAQ